MGIYISSSMKQKSPLWYLHGGKPLKEAMPISYSQLLALVSACGAENRKILWGFIQTHTIPTSAPKRIPLLNELVGRAINYYEDFIKPNKIFRPPSEQERAALEELAKRLVVLPEDTDADTLQTLLYNIGKGAWV